MQKGILHNHNASPRQPPLRSNFVFLGGGGLNNAFCKHTTPIFFALSIFIYFPIYFCAYTFIFSFFLIFLLCYGVAMKGEHRSVSQWRSAKVFGSVTCQLMLPVWSCWIIPVLIFSLDSINWRQQREGYLLNALRGLATFKIWLILPLAGAEVILLGAYKMVN